MPFGSNFMISESENLAARLLRDFPQLTPLVSIKGAGFVVHPENDHGFEVTVEHDDETIYLNTDVGFENHWHLGFFNSKEEAYLLVLEAVVELLSPRIRVVQKLSNNQPYSWKLQSKINGKWRTKSSTRRLFWNYLGSRSKKTFVNHHIKP